jgi:hypothetical protein
MPDKQIVPNHSPPLVLALGKLMLLLKLSPLAFRFKKH